MSKLCNYIFLVLFIGACSSNLSEPIAFDPDSFPAAPQTITVSIGDRRVVLSWDHPKPSEVASFNIYRRLVDSTSTNNIGSTTAFTFTDSTVRNGKTYVYQISSVNAQGQESAKSEPISAVPNIFSLTINSGNEFTNRRSVTLRMTAPPGTLLMLLSNDSLFTGAQWQSFSTQQVWTVSDGDGTKTVYAKFRDSEDREIIEPVRDTIILDTEAIILDVTEDTNGQIMSGGQAISFTLDAGEPGGTARIDIEGGPSNIQLFDGTVVDDGIYEGKYFIPDGTNLFNARVFGRFTDRAGNVADRFESTSRININSSPFAVTLHKPQAQGSSTTLRISWTRNTDADFAKYQIHRGDFGPITLNSTLITTIENQESISFTDTDLTPDQTYVYRVFVFDQFGLSTGSNEESASTLPDDPPSAVTLAQPSQIDSVTFRLTWSQSPDRDFESYRLFRSETSPVDTTVAPVGIINGDATATTFDDISLTTNITYFYRVFVYDKFGLRAGSNEVSGTLTTQN